MACPFFGLSFGFVIELGYLLHNNTLPKCEYGSFFVFISGKKSKQRWTVFPSFDRFGYAQKQFSWKLEERKEKEHLFRILSRSLS